MKRIFPILISLFILLPVIAYSANVQENNLYIEGYAASLLKNKYSLDIDVTVRNGELYLPDYVAGLGRYTQIIEDLSRLAGVRTIKLVNENELRRLSRVWQLPGDTLFRAPTADLRWPRMSAAYKYYSESDSLKNAIEVSLGETLPLIKGGIGQSMYTEVGVQAALFATYNVSKSTMDLINMDIMFGLPVSFRWNFISATAQVYHQRSNLGDRYLLNNFELAHPNFNYSAVDGLVAFIPNDWFRIYGGLGYVFESNPIDYKGMLYQAGLEMRIVPESANIPESILALDVKGTQMNKYNPTYSVLFGMDVGEYAMVTFQIAAGRSLTGQFFKEKITSFGLGVHIK